MITLGPANGDATFPLQQAINNLPTQGGTIQLAASTYRISAPLVIPSGKAVRIQGEGAYCTVIQQISKADGIQGVDVARFTLDGVGLTGLGQGSGVGNGINFTRKTQPCTPYVLLRDVVVQNWGQIGITISNPIVSSFTNVIAATSGVGFHLYGVSGAAAGTSCTFISCYANANTGDGYWFDTMNYCALLGCAADSNGSGYLFANCQGISLAGCGTEGIKAPSTGGITGSGFGFGFESCNGVTVDSCWAYEASGAVFLVTGSSRNVDLRKCVSNTPLAGSQLIYADNTSTYTVG